MREDTRSVGFGCVAAVVLTALVVVIRLALAGPLGQESPFLLFVLPVVAAAWYGGWKPGLLATVLGDVAGAYFFVEWTGWHGDGKGAWFVASFALIGVLVSLLCENLHSSRRRTEAKRRQLAEEVSERQKAEAAEREERERWRVTVNSIGDGVIATDEGGHVTYLNAVAESLTGWTRRDAEGQPLAAVFRIINEQTRQPVENPAERVLREGAVVGLANHTVLIARDGTERPIADSAAPIRDDAGRVGGVVLVFHDVTESRRAARLVRESEQRFRTLFDSMGEGFCVIEMLYDADGRPADYRFLEVNPMFEKHTGFKDGVGRTIRELVPDHDAHWFETYGAVAATGEPARFVNEAKAMGRWYDVYAYRVGGPDSHRVGILFTDITQRRRADEALRDGERRLRFVMDSMPQKILTAKPNGDVDYFNPQWTEFTGLPFEQIRDWGWTQFIHPDDVEENVRVWQQSIDTGEPFQFEHRFRRADGEYRWHISRAVPLRDAAGRVIQWVGSNTEVHAVKEAERAAVRRSEQVRRLAEVATRLNAAHDVDSVMGVVTEEARNLIGSHQAVTGFTTDQNWGQAINSISLSEKYARWRGYDAKPDGSGIYSLVCRMNKPMRMTQAELEAHPAWKRFGGHAPDHPPLRGWLAAPLVGRDGRNIGLLQLFDKYEGEFTEDDEAVLVQLAQMASVAVENARLVQDLRDGDRKKDEFLAMLAHELRNPLAPVRNSLEVMKRVEGDGELMRQARTTMERQVGHMVKLIDDLLEVSRISQGKIELKKEPVELASVLYHAVEQARPHAEHAGHDLVVTPPPEPVYLDADPVRLAQVFSNLLNNACKFTQAGGRIRLTAERQGSDVVVRVKDTGMGIPPDKLSSIFEMFTRVDRSLERSQGGLGIGLTLAKLSSATKKRATLIAWPSQVGAWGMVGMDLS